MKYSTQIRPISYLKAHAAEIAHQLTEQREPMIITQNGDAKFVLQDIASFEQTQERGPLFWVKSIINSSKSSQFVLLEMKARKLMDCS